jgi:hypothetical protein
MIPEIKLSDKCVHCCYFNLTFNSDKVIEGIGECGKYRTNWEWPREPSFKVDFSKIDPKYHSRAIECYECMTSDDDDDIQIVTTVRNINKNKGLKYH